MRTVVRLALLAALAVAAWAAPAPALANCAQACQSATGSCRKSCDTREKAEVAECLRSCDEQARLCPQMCEIGRKNKGDAARTQAEAKELYRRMRKQEQGHK